MTATLPTFELNFGGVRWFMQVTEELVVFSEQSGFYGRTKKVTFTQHPEMKHELGVMVQLQDETQCPPLAKHVETMHAIARFALGIDRYCRCWKLLTNPNEPCPACAEKAARRAECRVHHPIEAVGGGIWCRICDAPLNSIATARETAPVWLHVAGLASTRVAGVPLRDLGIDRQE